MAKHARHRLFQARLVRAAHDVDAGDLPDGRRVRRRIGCSSDVEGGEVRRRVADRERQRSLMVACAQRRRQGAQSHPFVDRARHEVGLALALDDRNLAASHAGQRCCRRGRIEAHAAAVGGASEGPHRVAVVGVDVDALDLRQRAAQAIEHPSLLRGHSPAPPASP